LEELMGFMNFLSPI